MDNIVVPLKVSILRIYSPLNTLSLSCTLCLLVLFPIFFGVPSLLQDMAFLCFVCTNNLLLLLPNYKISFSMLFYQKVATKL